MSRYIDADAIKLEKGFFEKVDNVPKFYEWLGKQPTIDAVPVVRCGECKYWDRSDPFFFNGVVRCECKWHENEYWTADGFCSDAERNDSEIPNS